MSHEAHCKCQRCVNLAPDWSIPFGSPFFWMAVVALVIQLTVLRHEWGASNYFAMVCSVGGIAGYVRMAIRRKKYG